MPVYKLKFFIPVFFLLIMRLPALAQVGNGSLGDPVFTFDFGSGDNPKFPTTGYAFVGGSCPEDGKYSLSKTEQGCHPESWHVVLKDHTGNDGYMMVVNADAVAGKEFFSKATTIDGTNTGALCDNTTYEFSAYVLNLIKAGLPGFTEPNITFKVETLAGDNIGSYTVDIPPTSNPDGWEKYGLTFTTPPGVTTVIVRMVNNAPGGAGNDFLLDDIAFRAYAPTIQAGFDGDVSKTEYQVCQGDPYAYNITATEPTGYTTPMLQWQENLNDGNGWQDIPGAIGLTHHVGKLSATPGLFQYRLGVAEGGNITSVNCRVYTNPVAVLVNPNPVVPLIASPPLCAGETLTLRATGGATYLWTLPNGSQRSDNPLIIPNVTMADEGNYHVLVMSATNCKTTQTAHFTVKPLPVITISSPQNICLGTSIPLVASAPDAASYSWLPVNGLSNPHSATPIARPLVSTLYTVTVTGTNGCISTATVQVDVTPLPIADAGKDRRIFAGESVKLAGRTIGDIAGFTWTPTDYLDDPTSLTPTATPPGDIIYKLTVLSANNCGTSESSVFVRVYQKIVIPNTFTPNNDGVNDLWNIEALETYPECTISIYTRSGKLVFQSNGYGKAWDGKQNGSPLPTGTYYYVIDLKSGTPLRSGWVLLLR